MSSIFLIRHQQKSFGTWISPRTKLRPIHDIIDDKDIEGQYTLTMLMLDGSVVSCTCMCDLPTVLILPCSHSTLSDFGPRGGLFGAEIWYSLLAPMMEQLR
jgi:hypothetical protein